MNTRVYDKKINIDKNKTQNFWVKRAENPISLTTVLLGSDKTGESQEKRNQKENIILNSLIKTSNKLNILDIGCGIGRWAVNLNEKINTYIGIDYTKSFIDFANNKFISTPNINFEYMSASDIKLEKIGKDFNLIICTGVLMYINDEDLDKVFEKLIQTTSNSFYIQETISLLDTRLTLNEFESKDLQDNYSAIYRTQKEYEEIFSKYNLEIVKTDLFLDDKTGSRKETNARYWLLKRS